MNAHLKAYVVIATKGRADDVPFIRDHLLGQTVSPARIIFVGTETADFGGQEIDNVDRSVEFVMSDRPGLTIQRNVGIERVLEIHGENDDFILLFFDDDFRPAANWIENALVHFGKKGLSGITGSVLADGILGPGISEDEAQNYLKNAPAPGLERGGNLHHEKFIGSLYGCNMAFSGEASRHVRFDETLPAYGWLEDKDYSRLVTNYGRTVQVTDCQGVHLGTKHGRTSGVKLGYSQVSNPVYLRRKGTMYKFETFKMVMRNIIANHVKIFFPEPWVDRKGRAVGNWRAIIDLVRGRITPQRINDF